MVGYKIDLNKKYLVVLIHPNTLDYEKNLKLVSSTFKAIKSLDFQTIVDMAQCGCGVRPYLKFFKIKSREEKNYWK